MKLFTTVGVLCTLVSLCAAQFTYNQQFGGNSASTTGLELTKQFNDNRTFRLRQVHTVAAHAVVAPHQHEIIFPGFNDRSTIAVGSGPAVAPIPVVRAAALIQESQQPNVVAEIIPNVVVREELEPTPIEAARPAPKKRVRVVKERVKSLPIVAVDNIPVAAEPIGTARGLANELAIEDQLRREEEAKNAHYSFSSSVQDSINDHAIVRSETRDGLALKGMYSYSDGFFKRTVHYEADENGYRVVK